MYDFIEQREVARELAAAFLQGRWRAEDLAERGAGVFDRRPTWLTALALELAPAGQAGPPLRHDVIALIERFLAQRATEPGDEPDPQTIRAAVRTARAARAAPVLEHDWPIATIARVGELAAALELSDGQLAWLADVRGLERTVTDERLRNYRYRWLARRSGLPRLIEAPKLRLKEVQRWLLRSILDQVPPHPAAHGFTRGRSARTHAALHAGQPAVLGMDLRDFFASVTAGRVFGIFVTLGYERAVAHTLTGLTTNVAAHIATDALRPPPSAELVGPHFWLGRALATPHLPQGAPTSPALANLAALGLDRRLAGLAAALDLRFSRYADDLTFSGAGLTGQRSRALAAGVAAITREEGFAVNPAKSRLRTAARRQTVTGVVVNAHPNLARDEYDRLRATLHRLACDGPAAGRTNESAVDLRAHLQGRVSWAESLNPRRGAKLRALYDAIGWDAG